MSLNSELQAPTEQASRGASDELKVGVISEIGLPWLTKNRRLQHSIAIHMLLVFVLYVHGYKVKNVSRSIDGRMIYWSFLAWRIITKAGQQLIKIILITFFYLQM